MNLETYNRALADFGWRDMSHFGRFRVSGADAAALLHHLTTNDIKGQSIGEAREAVMITNKGRVQDWLTVIRTGREEFLVVTSPNRREIFAPTARKFILFRQIVEIEDVTGREGLFGLFGPNAAAAAGEGAVSTLRLPGGGFLARGTASPTWGAACDNETFNVLRIEAGLPVTGLELTEDVNPWEADLDAAISLAKGCYNGQEIIARLHSYKKVKQGLMGLKLERVPADARPALRSGGKDVGVLTSAVNSPRLGAIGLGYVRNDWQAVGTELEVGGAEAQTAQVVELPFGVGSE
jgi:folate-binding protein YgfZ